MSNPPLIYVDLIEDTPLSLAQYCKHYGHEETDEWRGSYESYIDRFQPFRLLIKSGDNQEPLFKSTESYFNEADALHAAVLAFGSGSNVYLRQAEHGNKALRMATT